MKERTKYQWIRRHNQEATQFSYSQLLLLFLGCSSSTRFHQNERVPRTWDTMIAADMFTAQVWIISRVQGSMLLLCQDWSQDSLLRLEVLMFGVQPS